MSMRALDIIIFGLFLSMNMLGVLGFGLPEPPGSIVIVPGDGGNQMEFRLDRAKGHHRKRHWFCKTSTSGWETLWLQVTDLLPGEVDCWSENILLKFDKKSGTFSNNTGVEVRVPGFGDTKTIESLDPNLPFASKYMSALVSRLVESGFERKKSIAAATYDFRLTPATNKGFVERTVALVEKMFNENGEKKVALISHSMGSLITLFILNSQSHEWKDKYIHSWSSLAGIFAGSSVEFKLMASGDNVGVPFVQSSSVVKEQRTYETNVWMLPRQDFWPEDLVIVSAPSGNYTASDLEKFFHDIKFEDGFLVHQKTKEITAGLLAPRVPVHFILSRGVETPLSFVYEKGCSKSWFHHDPTRTITGDGDGTVNHHSLRAPISKWNNEQSEPISVTEFVGTTHNEIVSNEETLDSLLNFLFPLETNPRPNFQQQRTT